jgi:hypothetical protein
MCAWAHVCIHVYYGCVCFYAGTTTEPTVCTGCVRLLAVSYVQLVILVQVGVRGGSRRCAMCCVVAGCAARMGRLAPTTKCLAVFT